MVVERIHCAKNNILATFKFLQRKPNQELERITFFRSLADTFKEPNTQTPEYLASNFVQLINILGTNQQDRPREKLPPLISAFGEEVDKKEVGTLAEIYEECLRRVYEISDEPKRRETLQTIGQELLTDPTALAQIVRSSVNYLHMGIIDDSIDVGDWINAIHMHSMGLNYLNGQKDTFYGKPKKEIEERLSQSLLVFRFLRDFAPAGYNNFALHLLTNTLFTKKFYLFDPEDERLFPHFYLSHSTSKEHDKYETHKEQVNYERVRPIQSLDFYKQHSGVPRLLQLVDTETMQQVSQIIDPYLDGKPLPPAPEDMAALARLEPKRIKRSIYLPNVL